MRTSPTGRETFMFDPGQNNWLSRDRLVQADAVNYYASQGFDRNFVVWAPAVKTNRTGQQWSFCSPTVITGTTCPSNSLRDVSFDNVENSVADGQITALDHGGAFISLVCGNHSRGGRPGPVPTISGHKYEDVDGDGTRDGGEPGLAGWTFQLHYGGAVVATAQTDSNGRYAFALDANPGTLGAGSYSVTEVAQAGWVQSSPQPGPVTVPYGAGATDHAGGDFGNYRPATIQGRKFDDTNVDRGGASEPGLSGWSIGLSSGSSATTDVSGAYQFTGLRPGTYTVSETQKTGWRQTAPASGTHTVTVVSGQTLSDVDFGNVCLGSAAVAVRDISTSQALAGAELRLEEVQVPGVLSNDPALPRTLSSPASFGDLLPGRYRLIAFLPTGVFTADPDVHVVDGRWAIVKEINVAECKTTTVELEMFTGSVGKVTGGHVTVDGGRSTAGFEFMTQKDGPRGTLQFNDHSTGLKLHTSVIQGIWVSADRREAWVWGTVDYAASAKVFRLHLVDAGEPGTSDKFELRVLDAYESGIGQTLTGGNVQIHR